MSYCILSHFMFFRRYCISRDFVFQPLLVTGPAYQVIVLGIRNNKCDAQTNLPTCFVSFIEIKTVIRSVRYNLRVRVTVRIRSFQVSIARGNVGQPIISQAIERTHRKPPEKERNHPPGDF
jgi:hypothetical protein